MALIKRGNANTIEEVIARNIAPLSLSELDAERTYEIKGIDKLVELIKYAIEHDIPITIVGDYDADGCTATSELYITLTIMGARVRFRIPRRMSEGFGLSTKIIDEIDEGLVITVDNGIVAFDAIELAKKKGLQVVITDHHLPDTKRGLPPADLVIDPHLPGTADFEDYCGAGIAYRICEKLIDDKVLLAKLSTLAAIGTVADVVPLLGDNRQIVKEGLRNMVSCGKRTAGLFSMLRAIDKDRYMTATDIAFGVGPMINACGRIYDEGGTRVVEWLSYDDEFTPLIGEEAKEINELRKKLVKEGMALVTEELKQSFNIDDIPLIVYEPSIPEGIVGIIAGRLTETYEVPSFVFSNSHTDGVVKGSARTTGGVHLKNLLDDVGENFWASVSNEDAFLKYGGHAEAAGVSVSHKFFDLFKKIAKEKCPKLQVDPHKNDVFYDIEGNVADILKLTFICDKYEPYGQGNPKPVFLFKDCLLSPKASAHYTLMGNEQEHVKLLGTGYSAVGFGMAEEYLKMGAPQRLNLVGTLSFYFNSMTGIKEPQIEIIHMEPVEKPQTMSLLAQSLFNAANARRT